MRDISSRIAEIVFCGIGFLFRAVACIFVFAVFLNFIVVTILHPLEVLTILGYGFGGLIFVCGMLVFVLWLLG